MDKVNKLTKHLDNLSHIIDTNHRDSTKFMHAENEINALVFDYISPQSFGVIKERLNHPLTHHDLAKAVIAYKNGKDIPTVFNLSPKLARKFRMMMRFNVPNRATKKQVELVGKQLHKLNQEQDDDINDNAINNPLFPY